ncbi:MAG TPA: flavin reductase family protein [Candidatus Omnitrophota bacterium]|jgi:flavin reductase (DIM6/NTAB) family NADH-FMN oxidoreductase RutF|nr:MAG: Flavoredoxin [Candidatus Omnitrophica bacterium ADurb.Bin314]HOE68531.1 flavin reductase family protein [Candidatus Omnitrophota bacterium]HQB94321.1 flavin reductase family protein [Candidatus Omnitrophota bacterium]
MKKSFPLSRVYTLIEPGPVVMVSTALNGRPNVMTLAWHTMIDFEPPLVGCVISDRNYTFGILKKTGECVINIPTPDLGRKAVACGNISGRNADKFGRFGLTPVKASRVRAPLIDECYANLECKVADQRMAGRYNLFILEVIRAWIDPRVKNPGTLHHRGKDIFMLSGKTVRIPSRMK